MSLLDIDLPGGEALSCPLSLDSDLDLDLDWL